LIVNITQTFDIICPILFFSEQFCLIMIRSLSFSIYFENYHFDMLTSLDYEAELE